MPKHGIAHLQNITRALPIVGDYGVILPFITRGFRHVGGRAGLSYRPVNILRKTRWPGRKSEQKHRPRRDDCSGSTTRSGNARFIVVYLRTACTTLSLIKKMTVYYYTELRTRELLVIHRRHDGRGWCMRGWRGERRYEGRIVVRGGGVDDFRV